MALPAIPEDEFDLTPYLQEGAESSLLLCGLLTIGKTEYAPFILFPTEESISAGPKAKILDGWKMMTSTPSNISQRFVTIGGQQISICSPENADMNPRGLLVVGSNKKVRIGLQRIITNHYSFRDSVTPLPHAAAAEVPSFPGRVSYLSHLLRGDIPSEPLLPASWDLPQPIPGQAPVEWTLLALPPPNFLNLFSGSVLFVKGLYFFCSNCWNCSFALLNFLSLFWVLDPCDCENLQGAKVQCSKGEEKEPINFSSTLLELHLCTSEFSSSIFWVCVVCERIVFFCSNCWNCSFALLNFLSLFWVLDPCDCENLQGAKVQCSKGEEKEPINFSSTWLELHLCTSEFS